VTRLIALALATALMLSTSASYSQPSKVRVTNRVEQDLPGLPTNLFQGVALHFKGGRQAPHGEVIGAIASGQIGEDEAAALGYPREALFNPGIISCPHVLKAAAVVLAEKAKALGADAVIEVRSAEHDPIRPSYLCLLVNDRNFKAGDPKARTFAVSLQGVAVRMRAAPK
jgi:hypothetical protein